MIIWHIFSVRLSINPRINHYYYQFFIVEDVIILHSCGTIYLLSTISYIFWSHSFLQSFQRIRLSCANEDLSRGWLLSRVSIPLDCRFRFYNIDCMDNIESVRKKRRNNKIKGSTAIATGVVGSASLVAATKGFLAKVPQSKEKEAKVLYKKVE